MKSLFLVLILFLNSNGTVDVLKLRKCYSSNAHRAASRLGDPKYWNETLLPLDYFVLENSVTEEEWRSYCYNDRNHSDYILYEDNILIVPRNNCPNGESNHD